jgi:hypothetical protein
MRQVEGAIHSGDVLAFSEHSFFGSQKVTIKPSQRRRPCFAVLVK